MVKTKNKRRLSSRPKQYSFQYGHHKFKVFLDKVIIFRLFRNLHGRFWGIAAALEMIAGLTICFVIRPDMLRVSAALSDFSMDVRTAPYFCGSLFLASYGLWRWRNYLRRTLKRTRPILGLMTLTILGLLIVALTPNGWQPWSSRIHLLGMIMVGISAAATVIFDILLSKTPRAINANRVKIMKMLAFLLIVVGGWLTLGSSKWLHWFYFALPAEVMLIGGYFVWVILKTHQGEDPRSGLSRLLKRIILID
jgi:multisubunit Na+/H+ antiporter MnhG subunit